MTPTTHSINDISIHTMANSRQVIVHAFGRELCFISQEDAQKFISQFG
jgi:hypothetical protein